MMWPRSLWRRLRGIYHAEAIHREIDEEMRFHVEMRAAENIRRGMSPEEARRDAEQRFGRLTRLKEQGYEVRGGRWLETLWQDVRFGARMLRKTPGFTLVSVLTLSLGIGATSVIFSVVSAVLLRPLPYRQPEELVLIRHLKKTTGATQKSASYVDFRDWQAQNHVFAEMATFHAGSLPFVGNDGAENLRVSGVSANFFQLLGVPAYRGRTFLSVEEGRDSEKVAVLGYAFWQRAFGGDEKIINRQIRLNDQQFTVVGILRPDFRFPFGQEKTELWTTNAAYPPGMLDHRGARNFQIIARLKPGVALQTAQAEMEGIAGRIEQENQQTNKELGVLLVNVQDELTKDVRRTLLLLFGAVALVLLIACANFAGLLLARAASRSKEIAIRAALGAGAGRIARQLLTESLLLASAGGALGLLVAGGGTRLLVAVSPDSLPRVNDIGISAQVLAFTSVVSLLTGVVFGLVPALKVARPDLNEALKDGGRTSNVGAGRHRLRGLIVVGEISLAFVLLVGAGLLINSFVRLNRVELGFNPENVLSAGLSLPRQRYPSGEHALAFLQRVRERIEALPGVRAVGFAGAAPFAGGGVRSSFAIEGRGLPGGRGGDDNMVDINAVSPNYFRTLNVRLLQGRHFSDADDKTSRGVLIINESFSRRFFPDASPLGQVVSNFANLDEDSPREYEIVGVVADARGLALDRDPTPAIFTPHRQTPWAWGELVVRADRDAHGLAGAVRREIKDLDPELAISRMSTLENRIADSVIPQRFNLSLLTIFAVTGLSLAAVGVYGVVSYWVGLRTHEIGVRLALGAAPGDVFKLVTGWGMTLAAAGLVLGLAGSAALARLMSGMLYGVTGTDPVTYVVVALVLAGAMLAASAIPALRGARVDPLVALRNE